MKASPAPGAPAGPPGHAAHPSRCRAGTSAPQTRARSAAFSVSAPLRGATSPRTTLALGATLSRGPPGARPSPGGAAAAPARPGGGGTEAGRGSAPRPPARPPARPAAARPPRAYVAQPRGRGVSGGRPQRHVEHDDAIHDNERGNHHDEDEVPGEPGVRDLTTSPRPEPQVERRASDLTNPPLRREWGLPSLSAAGPRALPGALPLRPPVAVMKGTPGSLETLLWVYRFHSSTEVRRRPGPGLRVAPRHPRGRSPGARAPASSVP